MGDPAHERREDAQAAPATRKARKDEQLATRMAPTGLVPQNAVPDIALDSYMRQHELTDADLRMDRIAAIMDLPKEVCRWVREGVQRGIESIHAPELPRTEKLDGLLGTAVTILIAGTAGATGAWLVAGFAFANKVREKFVESAIKDSVKLMLKTAASTPDNIKDPLVDLKTLFQRKCKARLNDASLERIRERLDLRRRVSMLETSDLELIVDRGINALMGRSDEVVEAVANQTVVSWTNFLARAKHGAGARWESWQRNGSRGAIKLRGAAEPDNEDPSSTVAGNVDGRAIGFYDDAASIVEGPELFGILEVSIDRDGRIVRFPGWGMRLLNAGPAVRARIKNLGTVRELPVNKLVRLCSQPTGMIPPEVHASVVITADGYVRHHNLGGQARVHMPGKAPIGPARLLEQQACLRDLSTGKESDDCHVEVAANEEQVTTFAERAQDLPLSLLEV